jgi:hypothetical protein
MTTIDQIVEGVVNRLEQKGMVIVPHQIAVEAFDIMKAKQLILKRNKITPYEVAKFKLIGNVSITTIYNMLKDGRIMEHEQFTDETGKVYITREGINRLSNERI